MATNQERLLNESGVWSSEPGMSHDMTSQERNLMLYSPSLLLGNLITTWNDFPVIYSTWLLCHEPAYTLHEGHYQIFSHSLCVCRKGCVWMVLLQTCCLASSSCSLTRSLQSYLINIKVQTHYNRNHNFFLDYMY